MEKWKALILSVHRNTSQQSYFSFEKIEKTKEEEWKPQVVKF